MAVLSMSKQEFSRLEVLLRVQSGRLRVSDACVLIGVQRRQAGVIIVVTGGNTQAAVAFCLPGPHCSKHRHWRRPDKRSFDRAGLCARSRSRTSRGALKTQLRGDLVVRENE